MKWTEVNGSRWGTAFTQIKAHVAIWGLEIKATNLPVFLGKLKIWTFRVFFLNVDNENIYACVFGMCIYIYIHTHIYVYTHIYFLYTHTHTHTHTYMYI